MDLCCSVYVLLVLLFAQHVLATTLKLERILPRGTNMSDLRRMDHARHESLSMVSFPLLGSADTNKYGLYFAKIKVGSPPREYSVQIDTGSDFTWVSCSPCNGCPRSSALGIPLTLYNPHNSSTVSQLLCSDRACRSDNFLHEISCSSKTPNCSYKLYYNDQSHAKGLVMSDLFHFETGLVGSVKNSSVPITFGCSYNLSGRLSRPDLALDGILGLGMYHPSLIPQLSSYGAPKVFGHCLGGERGGGTLVVGEIQEAGIVYAPLVPHRAHYTLILESIAIDGENVPIDPTVFSNFTTTEGGTVVDSGTTLGILAAGAYDAFILSFTAALKRSGISVSTGIDLCFEVSSRATDALPHISLNFKGGASMTLKPANYLRWLFAFEDVDTWCLGFVRGKSTTFLGDIVLTDKLVVYDLERQQLGWVDFNCSRSIHVKSSSLSVKPHFKSMVINTAAFFIYVFMFL